MTVPLVGSGWGSSELVPGRAPPIRPVAPRPLLMGLPMDERVLLDDWLGTLGELTHEAVASLSPAELAWQPDPLANSVGLTVWHCARWLDVLAVRVLDDRPAEDELWQAGGWATRTGYDPRGIGYRGLGVITGYTAEEAAAVPDLPAEDLLAYLDGA